MQDARKLIGKRMQYFRKLRDLSQEELSSRIGIEEKSLSRLERGVHYPSLETLERIRAELGVELKDFFEFSDKPSADELRTYLTTAISQADYRTLVRLEKAVRKAIGTD